MKKLVVGVKEAQAILGGVSRSFMYERFKDGSLVPRKLGRRTVLLIEDVERYVAGLPARSQKESPAE